MAYTKQTWTTGDTITAEKLNHMEGGIEGASSSSAFNPLILESDVNFTYNQLLEAYQNRRLVMLYVEQTGIGRRQVFFLGELSFGSNTYSATFISGMNDSQNPVYTWFFYASDPDEAMYIPD